MEDKRFTTRKLLELVQTCTAFKHITDMRYEERHGDEVVIVTFEYPNRRETKEINVTADSCMSLIEDVWRRLYI